MLSFFFKGLLIGLADLVPGVSGGTVALLAGIYPRLIALLASPRAIFHLLGRQQWRLLFLRLDLRFTLPLVAGVVCSFLFFARFIQLLYIDYSVWLRAAFLGLVLGAALSLARLLPRRMIYVIFLCLGALVAWSISQWVPTTLTPSWGWIFLSGGIACAVMLLPGVSGSFMLLLLGQYEYILRALVTTNWFVLLVFAAGGVIGLLGMARLIAFLLKRYNHSTLAVLLGLLLGATPRLWPWQLQERLFVPALADLTWVGVMLCLFAGIGLAWWLRPSIKAFSVSESAIT